MADTLTMLDEARKQEEVNFHNQRETDRLSLSQSEFESKYANKKYYAVTRKSREYIQSWMSRNCSGKIALDYCCGLGQSSSELAKNGAIVYGIDISDESINTARTNAEKEGYGDRSHFFVMDAEKLTFEDNFFDIILCSGVLHHLDLNKAYPELGRVLKPNGKILCGEALGYNPVIKLYRKMTPHLRTAWEMEHILTLREVRKARAFFKKIDVKFFNLFTILAVPFRKSGFFKPLLAFLECLDAVFLKIPFLQLMSWQMIFELSGKKQEVSDVA